MAKKLKEYQAKAAKTITICAKCSDCFSATVQDGEGDMMGAYLHGYVPRDFLPNSGGDYVRLKIDLETGKILNWKKPTQADLMVIFEAQE